MSLCFVFLALEGWSGDAGSCWWFGKWRDCLPPWGCSLSYEGRERQARASLPTTEAGSGVVMRRLSPYRERTIAQEAAGESTSKEPLYDTGLKDGQGRTNREQEPTRERENVRRICLFFHTQNLHWKHTHSYDIRDQDGCSWEEWKQQGKENEGWGESMQGAVICPWKYRSETQYFVN